MSVQATFAATLVDEWVTSGVTDAVVCPGSRSTPLALALADRLRVHVRLDERSAGFFAIGLSMASGTPTVVCVTSGTAAAELHPAVVEAHQGRVPLIVCTADRPPELHHVGASQTIDQVGLFTTSTRWSCDPGVPEGSQAASWRPLAARAIAEARDGPSGPRTGASEPRLPRTAHRFGRPLAGPIRPVPRPVPPRARRPRCRRPPRWPRVDHRRRQRDQRPGPTAPARESVSDGRSWPIPDRGAACPGPSPRPMPSCARSPRFPTPWSCSGAPWLSKVLSEYVSSVAAGGGRVVCVDPWWQWTDPLAVVSEFHHVGGDEWIDAALGSRRPDRSRMAVDVAVLRGGGAGRHRARAVRGVERALRRPRPGPSRRRGGRHDHGVGVHADARPGMVQPGLARSHRS